MDVGIVYRYFPLSKYGFIKTLDESIFFHFSNLKDDIHRLSNVAFDIIETPKGKAAVNIRLLEKCYDLKKELFISKNPLYKWLAVVSDSKLYELERTLFNTEIDKEFNFLCESKMNI
ncbi:cold-shock protein [Mesonia maritima]|uniref:cold-shock protein n=1 Tax=Mesonia maritima TaxID=1793873 RepID=UPI003626C78E